MKKFLFVLLAAAGSILANRADAQQSKIGVFDIDIMVQAMPGYRAVDSMLTIYEQDSLRQEYDIYVSQYNRLDSIYKADSAAKKPATVLDYSRNERSKFASNIIYWQQISQQKTEAKRQQLAAGLYDQVLNAYSKVLKANSYLVVLKPGAYEVGSNVDNVFEKVARELKITLPEQLRSGPAAGEAEPPASAQPKQGGTNRAPAARPKKP